jgi:hypothetical protein
MSSALSASKHVSARTSSSDGVTPPARPTNPDSRTTSPASAIRTFPATAIAAAALALAPVGWERESVPLFSLSGIGPTGFSRGPATIGCTIFGVPAFYGHGCEWLTGSRRPDERLPGHLGRRQGLQPPHERLGVLPAPPPHRLLQQHPRQARSELQLGGTQELQLTQHTLQGLAGSS